MTNTNRRVLGVWGDIMNKDGQERSPAPDTSLCLLVGANAVVIRSGERKGSEALVHVRRRISMDLGSSTPKEVSVICEGSATLLHRGYCHHVNRLAMKRCISIDVILQPMYSHNAAQQKSMFCLRGYSH